MNIEIANRLVNLRKQNNLSQEALAEKLGISRQAVSKWERAEASPDTDNLILLARLYGVSLDELLQTEDEIPGTEKEDVSSYTEKDSDNGSGRGMDGFDGCGAENPNQEYVHVGFSGIHVRDEDGSEVHVGWNGIHVDDRKKGDNVHIDKNGVYVNGEKYDKEWLHYQHRVEFPIALLICIGYIVIGCVYQAWHPGWLLFLLIPILHSLIDAVRRRNAHHFAYPVLATLIFLCLGIFKALWHPGWVIFLTIPLYYSLVAYIQSFTGRKEAEDGAFTEGPGDADEE